MGNRGLGRWEATEHFWKEAATGSHQLFPQDSRQEWLRGFDGHLLEGECLSFNIIKSPHHTQVVGVERSGMSSRLGKGNDKLELGSKWSSRPSLATVPSGWSRTLCNVTNAYI